MLISTTATTTCSCILPSHGICTMRQVNSARNRCLINPTCDTLVEKGDQLIMMRPTCIASNGYRALPKPIKVDPGTPQCTAHQLLSFSSHQKPCMELLSFSSHQKPCMELVCLVLIQHCPSLMTLLLQLMSSVCHHFTEAHSPVLSEQAIKLSAPLCLQQSTDDNQPVIGDWDPLDYVKRSQDVCSGVIPSNLSTTNTGKPLHQFMNPTSGRSGRSRNDMYMLPVEYTTIKDGPEVSLSLMHASRHCLPGLNKCLPNWPKGRAFALCC